MENEKIKALREAGINPFPNGFDVLHTVQDIRKAIETTDGGQTTEQVFTTAGRMMAVNSFGKSAFVRFRDRTGQLQAYVPEPFA